MFAKISYNIKEFTSSGVRYTPLFFQKMWACTLKATPPSLKMNNPSRIEEWLTTDQEINMVHYVNERKLKCSQCWWQVKKQRLQSGWFLWRKYTEDNTTSIFDSIIYFAERQKCHTVLQVQQTGITKLILETSIWFLNCIFLVISWDEYPFNFTTHKLQLISKKY